MVQEVYCFLLRVQLLQFLPLHDGRRDDGVQWQYVQLSKKCGQVYPVLMAVQACTWQLCKGKGENMQS